MSHHNQDHGEDDAQRHHHGHHGHHGCGCGHHHAHEAGGHEDAASGEGVEFSAVTSKDEAIAQLEHIIAGLRAGTVTIEHDATTAQLTAPQTIKLSVKAGTRGEKRRLSVKMSWHAEHETPSAP